MELLANIGSDYEEIVINLMIMNGHPTNMKEAVVRRDLIGVAIISGTIRMSQGVSETGEALILIERGADGGMEMITLLVLAQALAHGDLPQDALLGTIDPGSGKKLRAVVVPLLAMIDHILPRHRLETLFQRPLLSRGWPLRGKVETVLTKLHPHHGTWHLHHHLL